MRTDSTEIAKFPVALAIGLAPMATPCVVFVSAIMKLRDPGNLRSWALDEFVFGFVSIAAIAYFIELLVGIPIHLLLQKHRHTSYKLYAMCGAVTGLLTALGFISTSKYDALLTCSLAGAISALLFRLIAADAIDPKIDQVGVAKKP